MTQVLSGYPIFSRYPNKFYTFKLDNNDKINKNPVSASTIFISFDNTQKDVYEKYYNDYIGFMRWIRPGIYEKDTYDDTDINCRLLAHRIHQMKNYSSQSEIDKIMILSEIVNIDIFPEGISLNDIKSYKDDIISHTKYTLILTLKLTPI